MKVPIMQVLRIVVTPVVGQVVAILVGMKLLMDWKWIQHSLIHYWTMIHLNLIHHPYHSRVFSIIRQRLSNHYIKHPKHTIIYQTTAVAITIRARTTPSYESYLESLFFGYLPLWHPLYIRWILYGHLQEVQYVYWWDF